MAADKTELETGVVIVGQPPQVPHDHPGGVGVGTIQQRLHGHVLSPAQLVGETVLNSQCHPHRAAIQQRAGHAVIADPLGDPEVAGAGEDLRQLPAFIAVVPIHDGGGDVLHVHIHGVAEDDCLQGGQHEEHDPHARVPENLDELLDQHGAEAVEHVAMGSP